MASVSFSLKRGVDGFKISDFTIGTLATNADDIEIRINLTDANGANVTRMDVRKFCDAIEREAASGAIFSNKPIL